MQTGSRQRDKTFISARNWFAVRTWSRSGPGLNSSATRIPSTQTMRWVAHHH